MFEKNLKRSRAFIRVFEAEGRDRGAPSTDERELLRGSVVFSIGALDNFVHELILELVPRFGDRDAMREPLKEISRNDPALALRVALASRREAEAEFRAALDAWLETKSFHGTTKVVGAMRYLGITIDETELPERWQSSLDAYTNKRHKIIHRGDSQTVKRDAAVDCANLVEDIGWAINDAAVSFYH